MYKHIVRAFFALSLVLVLSVPSISEAWTNFQYSTSFGSQQGQVLGATSLTESQIQSILSLLQAFGADPLTIARVERALRGGTTVGNTGKLQLTYNGVNFSTVPNITKEVAQSMCGFFIQYPNPTPPGSCVWNGQEISFVPLFVNESDPRLKFSSPSTTQNETIPISKNYMVQFSDSSLSSATVYPGKYRLYAVKFNTAGVLENPFELSVVGASHYGNSVNLEWNFDTNAGQIKPGWYYFHAFNTENGVWGTVGNYTFIVVSPSTSSGITVTAPNGGEKIEVNKPTTIVWNPSGLSTISIALYKNDQWMKWILKDIPAGNSSSGTYPNYQWTPSGVEAEAAPLGAVFKIYITGLKADGSGYVDDKSDAPFSFVAPTTTPPAPAALSVTKCSHTWGDLASGWRTWTWSSVDCTNGLPTSGSLVIGQGENGSGTSGQVWCNNSGAGHYNHPTFTVGPTTATVSCLYIVPNPAVTSCSYAWSDVATGWRTHGWNASDCTNGLPQTGQSFIAQGQNGNGTMGQVDCSLGSGSHYNHPTAMGATSGTVSCLYTKPVPETTTCSYTWSTPDPAGLMWRTRTWVPSDCTNGLPQSGSKAIGQASNGNGTVGQASCTLTSGGHNNNVAVTGATSSMVKCLYIK